MNVKKRIPIGCQVDTDTYNWLKAAQAKLQMESFGKVSMAAVVKDILRRAQEDKTYGDIEV